MKTRLLSLLTVTKGLSFCTLRNIFSLKTLFLLGGIISAIATYAGDGTKANPYTVSELNSIKETLATSGATVWVKADLKGLGEDGSLAENTESDQMAALFGDDSDTFVAYSYQILQGLALTDLTNTRDLLISLTYGTTGHPYGNTQNPSYAENKEPADNHFSLEEVHGALSLTINNGYRGYHIPSCYIIPQEIVAINVVAGYSAAKGAYVNCDNYFDGAAQTYVTPKNASLVLLAEEGNYDVVLASSLYEQAISIGNIMNPGTQAGVNTNTTQNRWHFRFVSATDKVGFERNGSADTEVILNSKDEVYLSVSSLETNFAGNWAWETSDKKWISWQGKKINDYDNHATGGGSNIGQPEPYVVLTGDTLLTFFYDDQMSVRGGRGLEWINWDSNWSHIAPEITTAIFDESFANCSTITHTNQWFCKLEKLTSIKGLEYLNTENVTDMTDMFFGCSSLTNLDLSHFNTANVGWMHAMFWDCSSLTNLNVNSFDTSNVRDVSGMFANCSNLTSLDVSHFNTEKVDSMQYMFWDCSSLTNLNVNNFDTSNVKDMSGMFANCSNLTSLDVSHFNTEKVDSMQYMFSGCSSLETIDVSGFKTDNVVAMWNMFYDCSNLTSLDVSGFNTQNVVAMSYMFGNCSKLKNINVSGFNTGNATSLSGMFSDCSSLETIDVSGFITDKVTHLGWMFFGCKNLREIDVRNFNTSNVTIMNGMFQNCSSLVSLDLSSFNTEKVESMDWMFGDCQALKNLDVSHFNTSNVKTIAGLFFNCYSLASIDVSHFNTASVTNMENVFGNCTSLTSIDVRNFDTSKVTNMNYMFGNTALSDIDVSNFNTENVEIMRWMFSGCSSLTSLDVSGFKTDKVTNMSGMFDNCSGLTSLDVSGFKTDNVTNMSEMFEGCSALKTIYAGDGWSTTSVVQGDSIFYHCTSLVGGAGTKYDANHVDHTYAHIDGGTANPGYFTDKNAKVWSVIGTINGDWDTDTEMTSADGVNFTASFPYLATGNYEFKIRANSSWDENYGEGGEPGGRNILVAVPEDNTGVVIWFNAQTKEITDNLILPVYTVPGSFNNWILDGDAMVKGNDGIYTLTIDNIPAGGASWRTDGAHEYKIAVNHSWDVNYGADGVLGGNNLSFNLPEGENSVTIYFDPVTHIAGTDNPQVSEQVATPTFSWTEDVLTMSTETENATISYTLADGYYLIGGNGEWSSDMSQKFAHTPGEPIYTYVLKGNGTDLWFAFGDAAALNAIDNGDWNQLFGASIDGGELSGTYDRRYNIRSENTFHVDGLAPFYRFSINTVDKTYLIEPLDSEPSFIPESNSVYTYTGPIEIKSDVFITAIAKKDGMKDSKPATMDYPYSAWKNLLDAESKGETAVAESAGNDKVPESLLNELKHLLDEAQHLYIERTAERATIEDMTVRILSLVNDITEITPVEPYAVLSQENTVLTFYYDDQKAARGGMGVGPFEDMGSSGVSTEWYGSKSNITTVVFDDSFANCTTLTSTAYWFYQLTKLTTIMGIQNLKMDNVSDINSMFSDCESLTSIDLSSLNLGNVTNMHQVFEGCTGLENIILDGVNTENVTNMGDLFLNCRSLKTIDLSSFNTSKVTNMAYMFYRCTSLTTVYVSGSWTTASVTRSESMFERCNNIVGGKGTTFDENHIDASYAHIDGGTSNPGYFTSKDAPEGVAEFDGKVATVSGGRTLDEAFEQRGGRTEAARTIAAIVWNKETPLTSSDLQGISNPNLLVYVNEARLAPSNIQNVVVNGMAREIVLTDTQEGNNDWYAPQGFVAERISYTRNFTQSTTKGTSRGWESIALPFDVQTIQHETKGVIAPFNSSASNKHFWLRRLTDNGLQAATNIEANTPYIISMPNSEEYVADYNLNGRVTFAAQNVDVPATVTKVLALADSSIVMVPAMQRQSRSSSVWALNVGEVRGQYFEGSVFERDYRTVRPFEAYTVHRQENGQPAPRYVPIQEIGGTTGIDASLMNSEEVNSEEWYDMQGRKLEGKPARKGVYISNGKKVVVK